MKGWSFGKKKKLRDQWPNLPNGDPVAPAYLTHVGGNPMDSELTVSLLEAYGIPAVTQFPNDGQFGKLIIGHAGGGVDIYVPETQLSEARDILSAEIVEDDGSEDEPEK